MSRIIIILLLLLLFGCTSGTEMVPKTLVKSLPQFKEHPKWPELIDKLPQTKDYYNAGLYTMNDNYYAQFCDLHGNSQWFKYDLETDLWKQSKYITGGCL
tara:strand:+ start:196 stop:495 length:300 start_codon:yes stop_codon:yes gene_type:complete